LAFPASPADGATTLLNGVTYVYSSANVSWSPYVSNSTVAYTSISISGNSNITGTETVGTSIVTGNESVQGNETVSGNQIVLGNLGVGTASPSAKLDVIGALRATSLTNNISTGAFVMNVGSVNGATSSPAIALWGTSDTSYPGAVHLISQNGNIQFYNYNGSSWTENVRITSSGNVGIGTTNPLKPLDVYGSLGFKNSSAYGSPGSFEATYPGTPVSARLSFGADNTGWQMRFAKNVSGTYTDYMTINDSGNVGIGTTSPAVKLDVTGTVRISNGTTNQYVGMSITNQYSTDANDSISFIDAQGRNGVTDSSMFFGHRANYGSYISFYTQANSGTNTDRRSQQMVIENNGTVYLYGGSGGAQLVMRNGGDLVIYNADNTAGVTLYCDTNGLLNISGAIAVTRLDGSTSALAAPNAVYLQQVCGLTTNGVYWINLPTVGATQIYCILDRNCAGGGWMLAMKGTRGTTFNYSSGYWTGVNTLNPTDNTRNDGDAKYNTYNYFPAEDWLAIWPDIGNGGDVSGGYGGWTWVENNVTSNSETVLTFMNRGIQLTKACNGYVYTATNPGPTGLAKYGSVWSMSGGFQWYGLNYTGNSGAKVRWGWATNNETDQNSNDINGGIGMTYGSYSAGDYIACCQSITGINRSARFEWYVR
jgi:hypothetical protein